MSNDLIWAKKLIKKEMALLQMSVISNASEEDYAHALMNKGAIDELETLIEFIDDKIKQNKKANKKFWDGPNQKRKKKKV